MRSSYYRLAIPYVKREKSLSSKPEAVDYLQKILTSRVYDVSIER